MLKSVVIFVGSCVLSIIALARTIRRDRRSIKEAIGHENRAIPEAVQTAKEETSATHNVVVSTAADKKFVAEIHPEDPKGQAIQNSIKNATWLAGWSAALAFIAASIYAFIAYCTLAKINEQTELVRVAGERENRAYVSVPGLQVQPSPPVIPFGRLPPSLLTPGTPPLRISGGL